MCRGRIRVYLKSIVMITFFDSQILRIFSLYGLPSPIFQFSSLVAFAKLLTLLSIIIFLIENESIQRHGDAFRTFIGRRTEEDRY